MSKTIYNRLIGTQNSGLETAPSGPDRLISEQEYIAIFEKAQQYITTERISELRRSLFGVESDKNTLLSLIRQFLARNLRLPGDTSVLAKRIFDDMTGYGFLNSYFERGSEIEEININSWDSVEIRYANGTRELIDARFHSPSHARDVLQRIFYLNNKYLDDNMLIEVSNIGNNIRIAAAIPPVADKGAGVAASIRFIHTKKHTVGQLVQSGMFTSDGFMMLKQLITHGISVCFCGGTGSGKTTAVNALLMEMDKRTRIITIEAGTREFDLVRRDKNGKIINNVVHLQTRPHRDSHLNIDLQALLDLILKFDPDLVVVGEMVSEEAFIAQETARTGHTVLTTIHTNNAYDAYHRMYTLGIRKYNLDENLMLRLMVEAYPIIVYIKQYGDNKRRVQSILEGSFIDGKIHYNELYTFQVQDNVTDIDGNIIEVRGEFIKCGSVSDALKRRLLNNGMPARVINEL
ncbi:MAG: CpaF family protein [Clostridiales bacterium]|nr:CpaF family protein [Clostridiales bacterium]